METLLRWYVCQQELQPVCVPALWRSVGLVSIDYAKGENSASVTGPAAGKCLTATPTVQFKNMAKGFLIAIEWAYIHGGSSLTCHVLSWCRTGHKLSFERRCLRLMAWQCTSGCASGRGCMIVLVACQFNCVPQCITPETKRKQVVGVNPGLAIYFCQGKPLHFPCRIPLFLITEYSVDAFAWTCLFMARKN